MIPLLLILFLLVCYGFLSRRTSRPKKSRKKHVQIDYHIVNQNDYDMVDMCVRTNVKTRKLVVLLNVPTSVKSVNSKKARRLARAICARILNQ